MKNLAILSLSLALIGCGTSAKDKAEAQNYVQKAKAAIGKLQFHEVVENATKAIELDNKNAEAYLIRGTANAFLANAHAPHAIDLLKLEKSSQDLREAARLDPTLQKTAEDSIARNDRLKSLIGLGR